VVEISETFVVLLVLVALHPVAVIVCTVPWNLEQLFHMTEDICFHYIFYLSKDDLGCASSTVTLVSVLVLLSCTTW
jgi:hypothetical protein